MVVFLCTVSCLVSRSYSTCSFNPLENEAVVCAALTAMRGEVQLEAPPREWWTQRGLQTRWVCPWLAPSAYHPFASLARPVPALHS